MHTTGVHGGFFDWQDHIFPLTRLKPWLYLPLPGIGSLYPLARWVWASPQDNFSEPNRNLVKHLLRAMPAQRPLLWAAGHEHNLQLHTQSSGPEFTVVSGSGSKTGPVTDDDKTLFAHEALGFMIVDAFDDGAVQLRALSTHDAAVEPTVVFSTWLRQASAPARQRRCTPQDLRQRVLVLRIQMLHQHEAHAGIGRQVCKQLCVGLKAAG
jgi:hypothetical protein